MIRDEPTYLVVIRERNDGGTHPQDHGRVDLAVGVGGAVGALLLGEVLRGHGQHDGLLLKGVYVLHHPTRNQVLPAVTRTGLMCEQRVKHPTTPLCMTVMSEHNHKFRCEHTCTYMHTCIHVQTANV